MSNDVYVDSVIGELKMGLNRALALRVEAAFIADIKGWNSAEAKKAYDTADVERDALVLFIRHTLESLV